MRDCEKIKVKIIIPFVLFDSWLKHYEKGEEKNILSVKHYKQIINNNFGDEKTHILHVHIRFRDSLLNWTGKLNVYTSLYIHIQVVCSTFLISMVMYSTLCQGFFFTWRPTIELIQSRSDVPLIMRR